MSSSGGRSVTSDPSDAETVQFERVSTEPKEPSLARASGSMAIATLASRITGFVSKLLVAGIVGINVITDSYTVAIQLPTIINELLIGGVLTTFVVPLLVRAQKEDADHGEAYIQRLLTVATTMLVIATGLAVASAPLLTRLYLNSDSPNANPELATAFAYLLLPEVLFFGLGALFGAILNARHVFGPAAWAPVLNNVVVIVTVVVYSLVPGKISLDPVQMGNAKLLVLGIGTSLGIVAQAMVLVPALRKTGLSFRWRWGWDRRMREFGGMALWVIAYVIVGQIGLIVTTNVASSGDAGGVTIYSYAWLLLQLPYGVLGVSLLTAIMPRMSRAAADGDTRGVVEHLSTGSRLSTVLLLPISAGMTALGTSLGLALFSLGQNGAESADRLGAALAISAFGLLPYAITMLQLRVFYAMKDSRTPTLLQLISVVVKVPLLLLCTLLPDEDVVLGLTFVNSFGFVVGAIAGNIWLKHRLGDLRNGLLLRTSGKTLVASVVAAVMAYAVVLLIDAILPAGAPAALRGWLELILGGMIGLVCAFGLMTLLKVEELRPARQRIARLVRRG